MMLRTSLPDGVLSTLSETLTSCAPARSMPSWICDVVGAVAGEPVDLVNDDVVDAALLGQVGEHGLQLRSVG